MVGIIIKITKNSSGISTLILIKIFKYVINPFLGIFEQLAWNSWYLKFLGQLGLPGSSLRHRGCRGNSCGELPNTRGDGIGVLPGRSHPEEMIPTRHLPLLASNQDPRISPAALAEDFIFLSQIWFGMSNRVTYPINYLPEYPRDFKSVQFRGKLPQNCRQKPGVM